ncbi:AraC family transcriptional regulator [Nocardia yamanashiensis]|uniref:AraC family transcriptional regulator n=1 Tax=Nocardia yamanashiensis TaxID=209247 RepID=UPI0008331708|nr:AraC family transcriptional regulator [Nocardia yamanashiensis]
MIDGTIPLRTAVMLRDTAIKVGATPWNLASFPEVDPSALGDERLRVPIETAWRMWELIGATGGLSAGLCASEAAAPGVLGVWDYLFSSRATLGESLRAVMEFRSAVTDPVVEWEVIEDGGLLTVRVGVAVEADPVFVPVEEFVLTLILRRIREATGQLVVPVRVAFTHRVSQRRNALIDEFGTGRIDFGAPYSEITFIDASTLPTGGDPGLGNVLCRYAALLHTTAKQMPVWSEQLHTAISEALLCGEPGLESVARRLSISQRTLQRRLAEAGTTWSAEIEQVRHQQARELLRDTELPVQSIATRIGYTDARTLRRAFHRWSGQTPDSFRKQAARRSAS